jgi:nitrite reductase/ring-hydroxylating ferredoxin subunit
MHDVTVCTEREVPLRFGKRVSVDGIDIVLMRFHDSIRAFENSCPHQRTNKMHEGVIYGDEIECPLHGWRFSLYDGSMQARGVRLQMFACRVENGNVIVSLPDDVYLF